MSGARSSQRQGRLDRRSFPKPIRSLNSIGCGTLWEPWAPVLLFNASLLIE